MLPEDYVLHDDVMASLSPERRAKILAKSRKLFLELELRELRGKRRMTQKPAAETMGVKQPSVNRIEARGGDVKLSTLIRKRTA